MFPFEFLTFVLLAGMAVGLVAGDAALYGDTLSLHINVSPKIVEGGFDAATAELVFIAESPRIVRGESIIPPPDTAREFASDRCRRARFAAQDGGVGRRAAGPVRL